MTVNELIQMLLALPEKDRERTVLVQGCDCIEDATGVAMEGSLYDNPMDFAQGVVIVQDGLEYKLPENMAS